MQDILQTLSTNKQFALHSEKAACASQVDSYWRSLTLRYILRFVNHKANVFISKDDFVYRYRIKTAAVKHPVL